MHTLFVPDQRLNGSNIRIAVSVEEAANAGKF